MNRVCLGIGSASEGEQLAKLVEALMVVYDNPYHFQHLDPPSGKPTLEVS